MSGQGQEENFHSEWNAGRLQITGQSLEGMMKERRDRGLGQFEQNENGMARSLCFH